MENIKIFDTTLRDGEQTPGVNLNLQEKLEIAKLLESLGVDIIEAGFPAASNGDFESVTSVAKIIKNAEVAGLCRAVESDIKRAYDAIKHAERPRIHTFIATSPTHREYKLKMSKDEVVERAVYAVKLAKSYVPNVEFSPEDGSRTELDFLYRVIEEVIKAGATTVNIPDTVGYATPDEFGALIRNIKNNVPNIDKAIIAVHCHDDLGLATANSLAGVIAGARQVECTINGIGERAGNAAMEEIIMGIDTRKDFYNLSHNINTKRIYRVSQVVSSFCDMDIPVNKSVVGKNAFRHESGIHQHGMLANRNTYEIMTPESIGLTVNGMVLGKHSGKHAFEERIQELGYTLNAVDLNKAFMRFKDVADRKKDVTDKDIEAIIGNKLHEDEPVYTLKSFQLQSGNDINSIAGISLLKDGETLSDAAVGSGPVDACFNAVDKIITTGAKLETYKIKAVTEGQDALGEVIVRLKDNDKIYMGKGLSTDIIEASVKAYINAQNRVLNERV